MTCQIRPFLRALLPLGAGTTVTLTSMPLAIEGISFDVRSDTSEPPAAIPSHRCGTWRYHVSPPSTTGKVPRISEGYPLIFVKLRFSVFRYYILFLRNGNLGGLLQTNLNGCLARRTSIMLGEPAHPNSFLVWDEAAWEACFALTLASPQPFFFYPSTKREKFKPPRAIP